MHMRATGLGVLLALAGSCAAVSQVPLEAAGRAPRGKKPLKVYILSGQSNMQGQAHVRTFDHLAMDPETAPLLDEMRNPDGTPRVCEDVYISEIGGAAQERHGKLTAKYGAERGGPKIGPEFTFGIYMRKLVGEPILLIKTAWGGKSINTDFRPPSAGPYPFSEQQIKSATERQKITVEELKARRAEKTGRYYRLMVEHVKKVLADPGAYHPAYDPEAGYEVAGFVWFQGWNDMVDGGTYPNRYKPGGYEKYTEVLAHFIRDVRKEFNAPNMPFVIGVLGVGGPTKDYESPRYKGVHQYFRDAMAAPASMPEFDGNVAAVLTERFWPTDVAKAEAKQGKIKRKVDAEYKAGQKKGETPPGGWGKWRRSRTEELMKTEFSAEDKRLLDIGKSNAGYHYLGSGTFMAQAGKAFAEAIDELNVGR